MAASLAGQLDAMTRLLPNWDGYGADPVTPAAAEAAKAFVARHLPSPAFRLPYVAPGRAGGCLVGWAELGRECEVEFGPDGAEGPVLRTPLQLT